MSRYGGVYNGSYVKRFRQVVIKHCLSFILWDSQIVKWLAPIWDIYVMPLDSTEYEDMTCEGKSIWLLMINTIWQTQVLEVQGLVTRTRIMEEYQRTL